MPTAADAHPPTDSPTIGSTDEGFRALVQRSRDIIVVTDAHGTVTYISPAVGQLTARSPDDIMGADGLDFIHPDDVGHFLDQFAQVLEHPGVPQVFEMRIRHADGHWIHVETVATNQLDHPDIRGIVGQLRDISARRADEARLRESERRFRGLVEHAFDLVSVIDGEGNTLYVGPSHETLLGVSPERAYGPVDIESLHPDDRETLVSAFLAARSVPGSSARVRYRFRHRGDGSYHHLDAVLTNHLHDPAIGGIVMNARDVTEERAALEALQASEERFRALVRTSSDVVSVVRPDGTFVSVSPAVEHVLGCPESDFADRSLPGFVHPDDRAAWRSHLDDALATPTAEHSTELRFRHGDGRWVWVEARTTNALEEPAIGGLVVHLRDITERRTAQAELAHQALHDPLTGLPNRALLVDRIERALARGHRTGLQTVVLFIDLDRFKTVNDSLGHGRGDELLVAAARRVREQVRDTDTVARLGGDEFVVLLEDVTHERVALGVAESILDAIRTPFSLGGRELYVTASIGLAMTTSADAATPDTIIRDADAAMYDAKARGRDRLEVFDEAIRLRVLRRAETEQDLHRALDRDELALAYQPSYDLRTGRIVGVEALLRWHHPTRGVVGPSEFIDVAEDTGLVVPIGEWVLDEACRQAVAWRALAGEHGLRTVWVNLSARQLVRPELPDVVAAALARHDLPPDALGLEITESTLIEEAETPGQELAALEALGVRLAIDDFGTGYSSLLYLRRYHVDVLKLDRSFVSGLGTNVDDTAISAAVIDLGHALGMEISAEGVEHARQWERLRDLGCDTACGFHLMRPTDPEAITARLVDQSLPTRAATTG
ncbi:MAG TPA: EAL domain-containing protein [Acidimicrobiia bacterium]|nr:EAL domain-containing protein [Acidimicrobiia bacterium]